MKRQLLALTLAAVLAGCTATIVPSSVVFVHRAPPPRRVEVIEVRPGPEYIWVAGYWEWRGGEYFWVGGNWNRRPHPRARWDEGRWRHHRRHGWYWQPGRWK